MLTGAPGALIKEPKETSFTLKNVFFKVLKRKLHKSQDFYTLFSSLASRALVNIFLNLFVINIIQIMLS
jgi:retron-type reverse transcriptase